MKNLSKIRQTVPVGDIQQDDLYKKLALFIRKQFFVDGVKKYAHSELPLVIGRADGKYAALSQMESVEAAKELGQQEMEVYVIDVEEENKLGLLLYTRLYREREHAATSVAIDHILEHVRTVEGKKWYDALPGDKEEKLAYLLGCSRTTIKRFLSIGKNYRNDLDLVQNGLMTWAELQKRINAEKKAAAKPIVAAQPETDETGEADEQGLEGGQTPYEENTNESGNPEEPGIDEYYVEGIDGTGTEENSENDNSMPATTSTTGSYEFESATITFPDGRKIEITTSGKGKELWINGKKKTVTYNYICDNGDGKYSPHYTTLFTGGNMGDNSLQIIFDNPNKFMGQ